MFKDFSSIDTQTITNPNSLDIESQFQPSLDFESENTLNAENVEKSANILICPGICCTEESRRAYQPISNDNFKLTERQIGSKIRRFQKSWFQQFHWITFCTQINAAFCFYCLWIKRNVSVPKKKSEDAFTEIGFINWKKAVEKFNEHAL